MRFWKTAGGGDSGGGTFAASWAPVFAAGGPVISRIPNVASLNLFLLLLKVRGKDHIEGPPASNLTEKSSWAPSTFSKSFVRTPFREITAAFPKRKRVVGRLLYGAAVNQCASSNVGSVETIDRKSTRLNSSHLYI